MKAATPDLVPKVHPATRPVEPEDPMNLHGCEVPGDPEVMLRMLVEEFARMGYGAESLMALCRDPFYHALHGVWLMYGEEELQKRISGILARAGVMRVRTVCAPAPQDLVQLER
jgi:hypothetical protein